MREKSKNGKNISFCSAVGNFCCGWVKLTRSRYIKTDFPKVGCSVSVNLINCCVLLFCYIWIGPHRNLNSIAQR